jgi:hypothetical protein
MGGPSQNTNVIAGRRLRRAAMPTIIAMVLLCSYLGWRAHAIAHGFPTPGNEIGTRDFMKDGAHCREYFRLKDGTSVRTVCPR